MCQKTRRVRDSVLLVMLLVSVGVVATNAQKLSAGEIIAKHLESIGKSDLVAKATKRMAIATSEFVIIKSPKKAVGSAVLASNGADLALFSTFDMRDYQMERIGLFGSKINIPMVELGRRSPLGSFLSVYDKTMDGHIFGGAIFSTWLFLDPAFNKGKLETEGRKKVGDRTAWIIKYSPKGGLRPESYIKLYFDAETFQHIRTVYRQTETESGFHDAGNKATNSQKAPGGWEADMAANGSTMTEDFDNFGKDAAGLILPHRYSIALDIDSQAGTAGFKWKFEISEYRVVNDFPAGFFNFTGQPGAR